MGDNSSGKSSLIHLLLGFHEEYTGKILIDDKQQPLKLLRNITAYTPSDPGFFKDSMLENIRLNDEDISINEVLGACEKSLFCEFTENIYSHIDEEGRNLNNDFKQRLSIARSLVHKREIYILIIHFLISIHMRDRL